MRGVLLSFLLSFCCDVEEGVGPGSGAGAAVVRVSSLVVAVEDEDAGFSSSMRARRRNRSSNDGSREDISSSRSCLICASDIDASC